MGTRTPKQLADVAGKAVASFLLEAGAATNAGLPLVSDDLVLVPARAEVPQSARAEVPQPVPPRKRARHRPAAGSGVLRRSTRPRINRCPNTDKCAVARTRRSTGAPAVATPTATATNTTATAAQVFYGAPPNPCPRRNKYRNKTPNPAPPKKSLSKSAKRRQWEIRLPAQVHNPSPNQSSLTLRNPSPKLNHRHYTLTPPHRHTHPTHTHLFTYTAGTHPTPHLGTKTPQLGPFRDGQQVQPIIQTKTHDEGSCMSPLPCLHAHDSPPVSCRLLLEKLDLIPQGSNVSEMRLRKCTLDGCGISLFSTG